MKKLTIFATLAVAAFSLSSCGFFSHMANSIANNPEFQVMGDGSNEGIYNGQTFRVVKTGSCSYAFESADPAQLKLTTSGSDAYVTGKLKNSSSSATIKLTARNAQVDSIAPVVHEVPVYAWELQVYDVAGSRVSDPKALVRGNTYVIKMVRRGGSSSNPSFTPVPSLRRGLKLSAALAGDDETIYLEFAHTNSSYQKLSSTSTTYTLTTPKSSSSCTVSAKLGDYTSKLAIATK